MRLHQRSPTVLRFWRYPGLSNSAFDDVTLNPLAARASERTQVMAQRARLNRHQLHGRIASGALRTLGLRVEQVLLPSVRSPELPGKPPRGSRFHGVGRNDFVVYRVALGTFEPAMLKAHGTRANARKHHAHRAVRTARALDGSQRWARGKTGLWHGTSLHWTGACSTLCHR